MEFKINDHERERLYGLPHVQQVLYCTAIRPYMDYATGVVGIKRGISHQSLKEAITVFPQRGFKVDTFSRDQVRRAVHGLERVGLIQSISHGRRLVLKCLLATTDNSQQKKAALRPPYQADTKSSVDLLSVSTHSEQLLGQAAVSDNKEGAMPPGSGNLVFMFEQFWNSYPQQCSKQQARLAFWDVNPTPELFDIIMRSLKVQKEFIAKRRALGHWVPKWKYPANWLRQRSWEDDLAQSLGENSDGKPQRKQPYASGAELIWESCKSSLSEY